MGFRKMTKKEKAIHEANMFRQGKTFLSYFLEYKKYIKKVKGKKRYKNKR